MTTYTEPAFSLDFKVRDYECDIQGVVNNSVYLNYMEHTRHEFLLTLGLNFMELHEQGLDAMVYKMEIDFKNSLRSGDEFYSTIHVSHRNKLKIFFHHNIYRKSDNKLCLHALVTTVTVKEGRPVRSMEIAEALEPYFTE